ncbi:hypothetical protein D3C87_1363890 [compost metagenome]
MQIARQRTIGGIERGIHRRILLGGSRSDGVAPTVEGGLQAAADQIVDAQLVVRAMFACTQRLKKGKQCVIFDAQIGDEFVDAERLAAQQKALALGLPDTFIFIAAQHGNLVQLPELRSPAPHQRAADIRAIQRSLDSHQRIGDGSHTHRQGNQFKKTHNDSGNYQLGHSLCQRSGSRY